MGLGLFVGLIYASDPRRVWQELQAVGGWGFLAVVGNVALSFFVWTWSWYLLLRGAGIPLPWKKVLAPMLAASAVTYLTPSAYLGGEPVRVYWVAKEAGVSLARVTATVLVERLLAGFSLLAFAAIGGFFAFVSPSMSLASKGALGLGFGVMVVLLALGAVSFTRNRRWISRALRALGRLLPGRRALARLAAGAAEMEDQIHEVFAQCPGHALAALALQLAAVFCTYIRPQLFFHFARQALFTFPQLSLFFTLNVFIGAFLWLTPGGLGLADGGRAGAFQLLGIPVPSAFAYNLLFRFVEFLQVGLGLYLLMRQGLLRWGRLAVPMEQDKKSE
ncbi:MAG: flippase-like domain-containing protein [Candidatus Bipolaricaulota bacterium]|nr:flippase-like domain-containing protein [Candidatus Bipolaricaulota bacterium]MCX7844158.1 flippase-like domain-containing protein [Candidatus Bipolaricaulota bacterium]MDW8152253.1 lysylphosphatidylglycerol synthase transmembrane domain-containing protein [Candidatus Bipolaricaulota bacterium]